jgi:ribonuclease E
VRVIDIVEPAPAAPVHAAPAKAEAPADVETPAPAPEPEPITTEPVVVGDPSKPKKGGWWARAKAGLTGQ